MIRRGRFFPQKIFFNVNNLKFQDTQTLPLSKVEYLVTLMSLVYFGPKHIDFFRSKGTIFLGYVVSIT